MAEVKAEEIDLRALAVRNDVTWEELKKIDWEKIPIKGSEDHVTYARFLAGKVRDYAPFYTRKERDYALSVERWLIRYSAEHTHPSLRQ
jgi:hypothetical protein